MTKITQYIFNRKKLGSILNNISVVSLAEHVSIFDIKQRVDNWCSLINRKILEGKNEISLQDSFLSDFFGKILDYKSIHESPKGWHLYREKKTITDATRSDGALGFFTSEDEDVRVVIELKNAKTSLDAKQKRKGANYTPVEQAFLYSGKFGKKCKWIIVCNYKEIRLYSRDASMNEYESFKIKDLSDEAELKKFLYLLSRKNLIKKEKESIIDNLYNSNEVEQEKISKEFYSKYKNLRFYLFEHLKEKNSDFDELVLLEKTQKILDRFIFVCYCEDFGLLPERIFRKMMEAVSNPLIFANVTQWEQLKNLFRAIDQGSPPHNINKFNGGLFEFDEILDGKLIIGDEIFNELAKITDYDFDSELNVNILGHIFEQSITDIEEIKSSVAGESFDKKKGKRKKDGIYYTPEYITHYIVSQAVGGWLEERQKELGFEELVELTEKDFDSIKYYKKTGAIKSSNKNIKAHLRFWHSYKEKLSNIKILDPACGSGAFLNQAFDYLYKEGQFVNEQIINLQKGQIEIFRLDEHILKNNLYGVDLNPESIEITKLSLWLKTADRHSELTALDDNIKCGNSLIDDPEIAGDRAFKWEDEFSEIMENGGFDVVIGNPPYGAKISKIELAYLLSIKNNSGLSTKLSDTYIAFYIQSLELLRKRGLLGFITPNTWRLIQTGKDFRNFLSKSEYSLNEIIQHDEKVFADATVDCDTVIIRKSITDNHKIRACIKNHSEILLQHKISQKKLSEQNFFNLYLTESTYKLKQKIENKSKFIKDYFFIKNGVKPYEKGKGKPPQTAVTMKEKPFTSETKIDESFSPLIGGSSFHKYKLLWNHDYWIKYGEWLAAPRDNEIFDAHEKLIFRQTGDSIIGTFVDNTFIMRNNTHIILSKNEDYNLKFILAVLNSKLTNFVYWTINPEKGEVLAEVKAFHLGLLCFPEISKEKQQNFVGKTDIMLDRNIQKQKLINKFTKRINSNLPINKLTTKLSNFYKYDFKIFVAELKKQKIKLNFKEQDEWEDYFNNYKREINEIQSQINKTEKEINQMVYKLYGLTKEEIKIVENAT